MRAAGRDRSEAKRSTGTSRGAEGPLGRWTAAAVPGKRDGSSPVIPRRPLRRSAACAGLRPSLNLVSSDAPAFSEGAPMDLSRFSLSGWRRSRASLSCRTASSRRWSARCATLALIAGFAPRLPSRRRAGGAGDRGRGACDYLINGASLKPLTEPARALLDGLPPGGLAARRAGGAPRRRLPGPAGATSRRWCSTAPASATTARAATAPPSRSSASRAAAPPACRSARRARRPGRCKDAEAALARAGAELRFLRDVLDRAPVLAWSQAPDGQVAWANAPYRDRFDAPAGELPDHRIADAFGHVLEEVPLTARGAGSRRRVAVPGPRRRRAALVRDQPEPRRRPARPSASRSTPTTSSPPRPRSAASSRP